MNWAPNTFIDFCWTHYLGFHIFHLIAVIATVILFVDTKKIQQKWPTFGKGSQTFSLRTYSLTYMQRKSKKRSCLRSFEAKHVCLVRNPPSAMVSFDPVVQEDLRGRNLTFLASREFSGSYQFCGNSVSVTFKFRSTPVKCFPVLQFSRSTMISMCY